MPYAFQIGTHASEDRLERLIADRLEPGANKEEIDARVWDLFGETWAVMFTDLSGFSRNVAEFGIIHFLQIIYETQRVLVPAIDRHDGIMLKLDGDSMIVIFRRAQSAIECGIAMQGLLKEYNKGKLRQEKILLCLGIGYGKMLHIGDDDVFGPEVNAAAKLGEDTAKAGEILVTDSVERVVQDMPTIRFEKIDVIPPGAQAAFKVIYSK